MSGDVLPHEIRAIFAGCLIGFAIVCARNYLTRGGAGILLVGVVSLLVGTAIATHVTTEVRAL